MNMEKYNADKARRLFYKQNTLTDSTVAECWHCEKRMCAQDLKLHHTWAREHCYTESEWYNPKFMVLLCNDCHTLLHKTKNNHLEEYTIIKLSKLYTKTYMPYTRLETDNKEMLFDFKGDYEYPATPFILNARIIQGKNGYINVQKVESTCTFPKLGVIHMEEFMDMPTGLGL